MNSSGSSGLNLGAMFNTLRLQRGLVFGVIIITALLAFEIFNYSTTDYALTDLLGNLTFFGVRWATILSIAFCGIDFAGIARLFTPEQGANEPTEVWYLFGAWLLAATMNAMLTWWGVSLAVLNHETLGSSVIARETLLRVVPIFVAVLVWLIRVLIIGTFSVAGDRLFSQSDMRVPSRAVKRTTYSVPTSTQVPAPPPVRSLGSGRTAAPRPVTAAPRNAYQPAPKPSATDYSNSRQETHNYSETPRPEPPLQEPTYHPVSAASANRSNNSPLIGDRSDNRQYRSLNGSKRR